MDLMPHTTSGARRGRFPAVAACLAMMTLAVAGPLAAADVAGPETVIAEGWDCSARDGVPAWLMCLTGKGASPAGLAFAKRMARPRPPDGDGYDLPGILTDFAERGAVDAGTVFFPGLANTNDQMLFLNGRVGVAHPFELFGADTPVDPATQALLARWPQAMLGGRVMIGAHRVLPDGTQRFVVTDIVQDGCRACEIVGLSVTHMEFRDGAPYVARALGWADIALDPGGDATVARIAGGDAGSLQLYLNMAGFEAGPMDGRPGPATAAALAEFRAASCPGASGPVSAAEAAVLVALADDVPTPSC
ncbi:MAG: hypothetical protein MUF73_20555 [Rhodobacteraceae bacterium]|jgi:hypothetical protein|nr:hypothetical protein [Paracoccaceae bacterium]